MKTSVELQSETWLGLLGRLLARPGDDHDDLLARCRDAAAGRADAGRFLGQFVDRIGDLSLDERRELYDETHATVGSPPTPSARPNGSVAADGRTRDGRPLDGGALDGGTVDGCTVDGSTFDTLDEALYEALRQAAGAPRAVSDDLLIERVLPAVERSLPLLESARNPFALLLKSICFAALAQIREASSPDRASPKKASPERASPKEASPKE